MRKYGSYTVILELGFTMLCASTLTLFWWKRVRQSANIDSFQNIFDMVGNTPIVRINGLSLKTGCEVFAKLEYTNPGGSSKDRIAKNIIIHAQNLFAKAKIANPNLSTLHIFEGTSGSTGISLALFCQWRGHKCTVVLPDDQSDEKYKQLLSFGASLIKVKNASITNDMHYTRVAEKLSKEPSETEFRYFANQFHNELNFQAHYETTAAEIEKQFYPEVFVHSAGTGGTIAGVAKYFHDRKLNTKMILADPQGSSLESLANDRVMYTKEMQEKGLKRNRYDSIVQGVGMNRMTRNLEIGIKFINAAIKITDEEMKLMAKKILKEEGLMIGSSSALNLCACERVGKKMKKGTKILTLFCSHGSREPHLFI
eukprot:snap_masked-scaffold_12-processed-gene-1.29-mRNA-1 protein AED:0.22 eAED:0.22 QI:0/-1/0/1/-1/1/1/0/368